MNVKEKPTSDFLENLKKIQEKYELPISQGDKFAITLALFDAYQLGYDRSSEVTMGLFNKNEQKNNE